VDEGRSPRIAAVLRAKATDAPLRDSGLGTFLNPHSYLLLRSRPDLLSEFDAIFLDGSSMVVAVRILLGRRIRRRSLDMTSLAPELLAGVSERQQRLAVIGGAPGVAGKAIRSWQARVGPLQVVHESSGYFDSPEERRAVLEETVARDPDVVLVGMGAPLQEQLLVDLKALGWSGLGLTCGGFLHQSASAPRADYYPRFFDATNLRWVYRMYDEPRLIPRYLFRYPWFVLVFAWDVLRSVGR